jgi:hypothetical protein
MPQLQEEALQQEISAGTAGQSRAIDLEKY